MQTKSIKIFSDSLEICQIESGLEQLKYNGFNPKISRLKNFIFNEKDILIFNIKEINSKYINRINSVKDNISNYLIFIISENNAVLVSEISKLGTGKIFVLPSEIYSFISHIQEIIEKDPLMILENNPRENLSKLSIDPIIGESEEIKKITSLSQKIAKNSLSNILIRGETGTGKGLLARMIHDNGKNSSGPFVEIVCSSLPDSLLESELFGYDEGAFTNAQDTKQGLFELAENGTVFLDEIGDLSINVQRKLLRVIEKKVIRHLGGISDTSVNARIVASTNMNLEEMVEKNLFREDLYHRLNVVTIELPPLRERGDDIIILTNHFIKEFSEQFNKNIKGISGVVKDYLTEYNWPGNIRELRNTVERAVLLTSNSVLQLHDFITIIGKKNFFHFTNNEINELQNMIYLQMDYTKNNLYDIEKIYAEQVYKKLLKNKSKTASFLGISRPKLDTLLK